MSGRRYMTCGWMVALLLVGCFGQDPDRGPAAPVPAFSGWRVVANSDLIVHGRIALLEGSPADEWGSMAHVSVEGILKGGSESGVVLRYFGSRDGASLAAWADSTTGALTSVIAAMVDVDGRFYLAASADDALFDYRSGLVDSIRAEVEQQEDLADQRIPPPGGLVDASLRDQLAGSPTSAQAAFELLLGLGCDAVPTLVSWIPDPRPLSAAGLSFTNPDPRGFEEIVHYTPEVITDALSIVLLQITGEPIGFINNGGTSAERDRVVSAWRTYDAYLASGAAECGSD